MAQECIAGETGICVGRSDLQEQARAALPETQEMQTLHFAMFNAGKELNNLTHNIVTEEKSDGRGEREIYFTGVREMRSARVWSRLGLTVGSFVEGPAVVEGAGSSALIPPGWVAQVDQYLNLEISCGRKGSSNQ